MNTEKPSVEIWALEDVKPYPKNAKVHNADQIENLAKSIEKFGWTQPIVVDRNGVIIAGHGRRLAAQHLGLKRVPVVCRKDLNDAEARALRLADNRVASQLYDDLILKEEMLDLAGLEEIDLSFTGFQENEINLLTGLNVDNMDESVFVEDVSSAVEEQKRTNTEKVRQTDTTAASVVDALGFKQVSIAQSREIRSLLSTLETRTGKKGPDLLISILETAAA